MALRLLPVPRVFGHVLGYRSPAHAYANTSPAPKAGKCRSHVSRES